VSRAARSRPAPLPIFPILLHVVFLRLPFLTDQPCPDGVRARSCSAVRNSLSRLRAPSAACADARANARRRSRSESVETGFCDRTRSTRAAGSQCGQPTSLGFTRTCRRYAPTRAGEREIIARPRTPKKHSAPECWSPRRVAPAAERCSNAVLECRVYKRFAVTSQLQNVAESIPVMCSSSGSSAMTWS
jgi:hypothetical protein